MGNFCLDWSNSLAFNLDNWLILLLRVKRRTEIIQSNCDYVKIYDDYERWGWSSKEVQLRRGVGD